MTAPIPPCPSWCTLPTGHPWDSVPYDDDVLSRGHDGPVFGRFVKVGATERSDAPGELQPNVLLYDDDATGDSNPSAEVLREVSAQALAAAAWVEALPKPAPACPPWCTRPPDHDLAELEDQDSSRIHYAPVREEWVWVAFNDTSSPGEMNPRWEVEVVGLSITADSSGEAAAQLRSAIAELVRTAEWLEEHP